MLDPILTYDRDRINARLGLLTDLNLAKTIYHVDGRLRSGFDPRNQFHQSVYFLLDEMSQRINNVRHHLGWANQFEEEAGGNNTIQAAISLLQAETLGNMLLALTTIKADPIV